MNALDQYIDRLDELVKRLSPTERAKLSRDIGTQVRQSNKRRIQANISPEGVPFAQRQGVPQRPLRKNETVKVGQQFLYVGTAARMRTIKTAASAAHPSRRNTQPHDADYVWGYDLTAGGIRKYRRSLIGMESKRTRARLMFRKIHQYKYLKLKADSHGAAVGFLGGLTAHIAAAHQYGQENRPQRELLGFSEGDLQLIEEILVRHLAEK